MMQFRVVPASGGLLKPRRALVRVFGLVLAALPFFAGYVLILLDGRRRGLQDRLARKLVVDARLPSPKLEDDSQTATQSDRFRQTTQEQI